MATVTCRVATPAALVAMKLQSAPRRRAERAQKGPEVTTGTYSVYLAPRVWPGSHADLPGAPHDLGSWCVQARMNRTVHGRCPGDRQTSRDPSDPGDMEKPVLRVLIRCIERGRIARRVSPEGRIE